MLRPTSDEEMKENRKELSKFCKDNHCEMYNYMNHIKSLRANAKDDGILELKSIVSKRFKDRRKVKKEEILQILDDLWRKRSNEQC